MYLSISLQVKNLSPCYYRSLGDRVVEDGARTFRPRIIRSGAFRPQKLSSVDVSAFIKLTFRY